MSLKPHTPQHISQNISIELLSSLDEIDANQWNTLTDGTPVLSHEFLSALEHSGSIGLGTGWSAYPLVAKQSNQLIGAMPMYLKSHSYGEYVFDWAWADAYQRSGLNYYPKLLCAVPFSPITSARLLAKDDDVKNLMIDAIESAMRQHELSSAHVLFPDDACAMQFEAASWLKRTGVQFRWHNKNYANFEEFLTTLNHDKRKKIHQERKKVQYAGVTCKWIKGADITANDWDFFYQCYANTYREHHSTPYLTHAFFAEIGSTMPNNLLLILAQIDGKPIASTLNIYSDTTLYGRYWGAVQFISGLHFELCYYQAQEFCIAENIEYFEGGAQGEHKLARGFEARPTCSYHKIAHADFELAIQQFLVREQAGIAAYVSELEQRAPFKAG